MNRILIVFSITAALCLSGGCKKSSAPAVKSGDAVQQKLQELAGDSATDCGRPKTQGPDELKTAGDCAMQAAQKKHPFYVAYDLPGMTVAIAGNSEGKLFTVRSEAAENSPAGAPAQLTSAPCPAELRIAQSGRTTCFPVGSFGMSNSMGGSPHGGSMSMPPAGSTPNPHGGMMPQNPGDSGTAAPTKQH